jgi:hypothetical protein
MEPADPRDSWTYRNPDIDATKYQSFIIEPTLVSEDAAATFGEISKADQKRYAAMFTDALREQIGEGYTLATKKGPGVGVIQLTLLGVTPNSPVAIATRVTPTGLALSSVKSLAGRPGSFSGSAQIAFELKDSVSGDLIAAAIRRRSPDALDLVATTSTDSTISSVAKDVAKAIRAALDKANGKTTPTRLDSIRSKIPGVN